MTEKKFKIYGVGIKIELARTEKKWNQEELGKRIGVKRQTIGRWESGETIPDEEKLKKISTVTNKPLSFFSSSISLYPNFTPEILESLNDDPAMIKMVLTLHKNSQDIKDTIKAMLECLPNLSLEKRQAILALCR